MQLGIEPSSTCHSPLWMRRWLGDARGGGSDSSAEGGTRGGDVRDALGSIGFIASLAPMPPYCALFPAPSLRGPPPPTAPSPATHSILFPVVEGAASTTHTSMRTCLASTVESSGRSVATTTYKVYYPLDTNMLLEDTYPKVW